MKAVALPLDDRPCNYEALIDLSRVGKIDLSLPPREIASSHLPEYPYSLSKTWFEKNLRVAAFAIISLDFWIYGGLIRSRKMEISLDEARKRISDLKLIIKENPNTRFYLSSVLLRLSITLNEKQSEEDWRNIFEYSVIAAGTDPNSEKLADLEKKIPTHLLKEYLRVRERNHQVSLEVFRELGECAETLLYGQEDCAPEGLHQKEKARLRAQIGNSDRAQIVTGADELNAMLLARAFSEHHGCEPLELYFDIFPKGAENFVSKYEDLTIEENLNAHVRALPIVQSRQGVRTCILGFSRDEQQDLCFPKDYPSIDADTARWAQTIRAGDAVLDLRFANGADPSFVGEILKKVSWSELRSFSAWNTTGNSLGTLLAHLVIRNAAEKSNRYDASADRFYLLVHWLDDFLYQSIARKVLFSAAEKEGLNPWALGKNAEDFSRRCNKLMHELAHEWKLPTEFTASLAWPRLFEVLIQAPNSTRLS